MDDSEQDSAIGEVPKALPQLDPPDQRNVSITWDGRRLDTKDKVLAFLAELDAARQSDTTLGPPLP